MDGPYPLHLAFTAPGQFGGTLDRLTYAAQRDDALMGGGIGDTPRVFAGGFGKLHTLTLSLAACLIVIARHLQGQLEEQLLHRLQHDPGDAVSPGREIGQNVPPAVSGTSDWNLTDDGHR